MAPRTGTTPSERGAPTGKNPSKNQGTGSERDFSGRSAGLDRGEPERERREECDARQLDERAEVAGLLRARERRREHLRHLLERRTAQHP